MNCCLKSLQNIVETECSGQKSQQKFDPRTEISIEIDRNVKKSTEDKNLERNSIRRQKIRCSDRNLIRRQNSQQKCLHLNHKKTCKEDSLILFMSSFTQKMSFRGI